MTLLEKSPAKPHTEHHYIVPIVREVRPPTSQIINTGAAAVAIANKAW
jgi:hypothetical protein